MKPLQNEWNLLHSIGGDRESALGSELSRTGREPSASRLYEGKTIAKLKDVERILISNNMLYLGVEQFTSLTYESIDDRDREFYQLK